MPNCPAGHESAATDFCDICGMRISGQPVGSGSSLPASSPGGPAEPCPQCGSDRAGLFCEVCGFDFSSGTPSRPAARAAATVSSAGSGVAPDPRAYPASAPPATSAPGTATSGTATSGTAATAGAGHAPAGEHAQPQASPAPEAGAAQTAGAGLGWTAVVTADRAYYDTVIAAGGPDAASIEFPSYCPDRRFRLSGKEIRIGRRSVSRGLEPEIDLTGPPADPGISHLHAVLIAQPDGTWSVLDPGSSNGTQVNGAEVTTGVPVPLSDGDRICIGAWTTLTIQAS